jgi:hypothetical protein
MVMGTKYMVARTKTYGCGNKKPMAVGTQLFFRGKNLLLGKEIIGCGKKSMVRTNICGNKVIWLWEQRHMVVGTKEYGCRNKKLLL